MKQGGGLKAENNGKEIYLKGEQNRRNTESCSLTMERNRRGSKQVSLLRTADPCPTRAAARVFCHGQELRMLI